MNNIGMLVGMRPDPVQGNFEFFKWDFLANFRCFSVGFSAVFQWIFRAEKEKVAAILCTRLHENHRFTTTTTKTRTLPSTRSVVAEATRGQAPLTPVVPLRQMFFDEESLVFGKNCYFMIFLGEGK